MKKSLLSNWKQSQLLDNSQKEQDKEMKRISLELIIMAAIALTIQEVLVAQVLLLIAGIVMTIIGIWNAIKSKCTDFNGALWCWYGCLVIYVARLIYLII